MNILIVTQYFWPENFKVNDLALTLVEEGNEVTVLTGLPNYPEGRVYKGYKSLRSRRQQYKGINIIRIPMIPRLKGKGWQLSLNYLSFTFSASFYSRLFLKGRFDKIFVFEISPVTVGIPAITIKKKFKIPIIFWVLDLWPESVFAASNLKSKWIKQILTRLVKYIYMRCDLILVSSKAFTESIIQKGIPPERISYFPNWAEDLFLEPVTKSYSIPELPTGFKIMFAGNIGESQDFETLLSAAREIKDIADIKWIVIGDGRRKDWLLDQIKVNGLEKNFVWKGRFPLESMPGVFNQADVMLLSLKPDPIFSLTVPAKLQTYMASKKPVIGVISGEGERIISESGAGFSCESGDAETLSMIVLQMHQMSEGELLKLSQNGYDYYMKNFQKNKLIKNLMLLMNKTSYNKL